MDIVTSTIPCTIKNGKVFMWTTKCRKVTRETIKKPNKEMSMSEFIWQKAKEVGEFNQREMDEALGIFDEGAKFTIEQKQLRP